MSPPAARRIAGVSAFAALIRPATEKLIELGRLKPDMAVLDLGCGDGPVSYLATERLAGTGRLVALDSDDVALEAARRNLAATTATELVLAPLDASGLAADTFDVCIAQLAFDRAPDPASAAAEALRVLLPGGRLVALALGAQARNEFVSIVHDALSAADADIQPLERRFRFGGPADLQGLLERAGFLDVQCQAVRVMLRATDAHGWWITAASVAGWPAQLFGLARPRLEELCAVPGGARLSVEIMLALGTRPIDERAAARPRSFDDLAAGLRSRIRELSAFEARRGLRGQPTIFLDVREADERVDGMLPDSVNLPRGLIEQRIGALVPDRRSAIVVYSEDGRRSALAALRLQELGYESVWNLTGGIRSWRRNGYAIEPVR